MNEQEKEQKTISSLLKVSEQGLGTKILIIEDNPEDVQTVRALLGESKDFSFECHAVDHFEDAMQFLMEKSADVILLDLSLPDSSSFQMFERLRLQYPLTPVIVLTGTDDEQLAMHAVRQGAQDYLVKNKLNAGLLVRSIRYAIERHRLLQDVLEQKKDSDQIRASLKEKDVLLKEVYHRVKNNLQIISSLLRLQIGSLKDERDVAVFRDCQDKIKAMALIHEILYQSENLAKINFADYLRKLSLSLFHSFGVQPNAIMLEIHAENILLGVDIAIPCGLIINELVSNAIKHAFIEKRKGKLKIRFFPDPEKSSVTMIVEDSGIGFPKDLDIKKTPSLGLKLVTTLTDQLNGTIELMKKTEGAGVKIVFPSPAGTR